MSNNFTTVNCNSSTTFQQELWEYCFRLVVVPILSILYCIVLYVIWKYPADFKNSYFTFVLALGASDILKIIFVVRNFILDLIGYNFFPESIENLLLFFENSFGSLLSALLNLFISVNRFCAIVFFKDYQTLFTIKKAKIIILFGMIFGPPFCWINFTCTAFYDPTVQNTVYRYCRQSTVKFYYLFLSVFSSILCISVLIIYAVALCFAYKRFKSTSASRIVFVREFKMLLHGVFLVVLMICIPVLAAFESTRTVGAAIFHIYISLNPVIYIIMDSKVRKHVRKLLCPCQTNEISPVHFFGTSTI